MRKINEDEFPEPFKQYWNSKGKIERDYDFYLDDKNNLYIHRKEMVFLIYWMDDSCAGIFNFINENQLKRDESIPSIKCICGSENFKLRYGDYELIGICPKCGKNEIVYSG